MEKQKNKKNNAAKRNQASNIPKIKKRRNKVVAIGDQKRVGVRFINKNLTLTYEHTVEMNMDECFQQNVVLC